MAVKLKYIKTSMGEIIIFPISIEHDVFKNSFNPISAGFCEIDGENKQVKCYGESFSLKLKCDDENDSLQATKHCFGVEAMINSMATDKEKCQHEYSDGTGTGWYICKKCGHQY